MVSYSYFHYSVIIGISNLTYLVLLTFYLMKETYSNKNNVLSVFGLGKLENLIMRMNVFVQDSDLILK